VNEKQYQENVLYRLPASLAPKPNPDPNPSRPSAKPNPNP